MCRMHSRGGVLGPTSRHHAYVAWWIGYSIHSRSRTCGCPGRRGRPARPVPLRINSMKLVLHLTFSISLHPTQCLSIPVHPTQCLSIPVHPTQCLSPSMPLPPSHSVPLHPSPSHSMPLHPSPSHSMPLSLNASPCLSLAMTLPPSHSVPLNPSPSHSVPLHPSPSHSVPLNPSPSHSVPLHPTQCLSPSMPLTLTLTQSHALHWSPAPRVQHALSSTCPWRWQRRAHLASLPIQRWKGDVED